MSVTVLKCVATEYHLTIHSNVEVHFVCCNVELKSPLISSPK